MDWNAARDNIIGILEKGLVVKNQRKKLKSLHMITIVYEVKLYSYSGRNLIFKKKKLINPLKEEMPPYFQIWQAGSPARVEIV